MVAARNYVGNVNAHKKSSARELKVLEEDDHIPQPCRLRVSSPPFAYDMLIEQRLETYARKIREAQSPLPGLIFGYYSDAVLQELDPL